MDKDYKWVEKVEWKKYYAPFEVKKDNMYFDELKQKLKSLVEDLEYVKADVKFVQVAKKYTDDIVSALNDYYKGNIYRAQETIDNLVKGCLNSKIAVSHINDSIAFYGKASTEVQFFRARLNNAVKDFPAEEMLHIPFDMRERVKSERFSVPGLPCLYLGNTSYACWIEMGKPADYQFNVSPVRLDNSQKIFNLAVSVRDILRVIDERGGEKGDVDDEIATLLKLIIMMIATSYRVEEKDRNFKSEYIISQLIMLSCKEHEIDGITYFSKQVSEEIFARVVGVNLVLFAKYNTGDRISEIRKHIEIDDSFNLSMYKHLLPSLDYKEYDLRIDASPYINNIGSYNRQFPYRETDFYGFDRYLFANWSKK